MPVKHLVNKNLEVLKVLQKSYYGKIKCIIIDPPYNTDSNSFIYPDKFKENKADYEKRIGDKDEEGVLMKEGLFRKNSKDSGHFHSNWLSMMYPRLFLAKNLLRDDGVIFVHIDDNEVHNLRLLMNEIFGEENFFAQVIIRSNSRGQTYKQIAKTHEYLLIYTKNFESDLNELEKDEINNDLNLKDKIGNFNIRELRNRNPKSGKFNRPNLFYPIYINPNCPDDNNFFAVCLERNDFGYQEDKGQNIDLGFKVFKLAPSNFKIWRGDEITEDNLVQQLEVFTDPVDNGSEKENMLYELILKSGYSLTDKIESKEKFFSINGCELIISLEEMNETIVLQIIAAKPKKVITLDNLFAGNDQLKTNTVLQMRDSGVEFKTI